MAWHLAGTIIISFLVLGKDLPYPYINPDYNSPLIYWWGYCNLSIGKDLPYSLYKSRLQFTPYLLMGLL